MSILRRLMPWRRLALGGLLVSACHCDGLAAPPKSEAVRTGHPLAASGRTGPLELTLTLREREVPKGGRIYFRLTLKNIGKQRVSIHDNIFKDPIFLGENRWDKRAAYLEVTDSKGKPAFFLPHWAYPLTCPPPLRYVRPRTEEEKKEEESNENLLKKIVEDPRFSSRRLGPGESIVTPPWRAPVWADCKEAERKPEDAFTELWNVPLRESGGLRVRAVYANPWQEALFGKYGLRPEPENVIVTTDWLEVSVR